jgi:hypothetical protein
VLLCLIARDCNGAGQAQAGMSCFVAVELQLQHRMSGPLLRGRTSARTTICSRTRRVGLSRVTRRGRLADCPVDYSVAPYFGSVPDLVPLNSTIYCFQSYKVWFTQRSGLDLNHAHKRLINRLQMQQTKKYGSPSVDYFWLICVSVSREAFADIIRSNSMHQATVVQNPSLHKG